MGKTAMKHLIEKINRMPETSIKNFIKLLKDEYLIMEKEQIINAHLEGWADAYDYLKDEFLEARQAENYYNETYGNANN